MCVADGGGVGAGGGGGSSLGGVLTTVSLLAEWDRRGRWGRERAGVGGREDEEQREERDIGEDEQEEETDRDVTGDQARERQALAGFAGSFDLTARDMARDDGNEPAEAPGAKDRRRGE